MTPMLGIMASQISGHLSSFFSIATLNGTGSGTTVTFSSIPNTYKSLHLRMMMHTTQSSNAGAVGTLNGDGAANYANHSIYGTGGSVTAFGQTSNSNVYIGWNASGGVSMPSQALNANFMGVQIWDIIDYASTSKTKVIRQFAGMDQNDTGANNSGVGLTTTFWNSTAAINSISIACGYGNFSASSTFALYGVK